MQTILSSLLVLIAALYVTNQWLPQKLKQRLRQIVGKSSVAKQSAGACASCSSCGNCGNDGDIDKSDKKVMFIRSK